MYSLDMKTKKNHITLKINDYIYDKTKIYSLLSPEIQAAQYV